MQSYNTIESPNLFTVLKEVAEDQILMKVFVWGHAYERLTLITGLQNEAGSDLFRIDLPEGLEEILSLHPATKLNFEFTGRDRLPHKFESTIQKVSPKEITLFFPDVIYRYQARNDFRIDTPAKTELSMDIDGSRIRMSVENISLGGVFCNCLNRSKPLVESCPQCTDAKLLCTLNDQCIEISINKIEMCRIQPLRRPKHFGVAYAFVELEAAAKKQLTRLIYDLQREFLQNRTRLG